MEESAVKIVSERFYIIIELWVAILLWNNTEVYDNILNCKKGSTKKADDLKGLQS